MYASPGLAPRGASCVSPPSSSAVEQRSASCVPMVDAFNSVLGDSGPVVHQQNAGRNDPGGRRGSTSQDRPPRLYAITRADLPVGLRTAQVGHALISWTLLYGAPPDNLVVLQVPGAATLEQLRAKLAAEDCVVGFREPDLGDELTAIAAGPECWRALSSLPLLR